MSKGALKSKITNSLKDTSELLTGFCPWDSLEDWCRIPGPRRNHNRRWVISDLDRRILKNICRPG